MLREPLTLNQARAWGSWIAVSGQLNIVSEWLPGLPKERLDVVKRTMPMTGLCGRPLDLLENDPAKVWHLADTRGGMHARRDVIALFNWDEKQAMDISVDLTRLGLEDSNNDGFSGFSFWDGKFLDISRNTYTTRLPGASCVVIALRPRADHPQVISTSRHVTQGIVDVTDETWKDNALCGSSAIVGNDPYELRIDAPPGFTVEAARANLRASDSAVNVDWRQSDSHVTASIKASVTCVIDWQIEFAERG